MTEFDGKGFGDRENERLLTTDMESAGWLGFASLSTRISELDTLLAELVLDLWGRRNGHPDD